MKNTMIKIAAVVIAALMVFSLAACTQGAEKSVDIYALTDEMQSAVEMPAMLSIKKGDGNDKKGFAAISDMDYAKVAEFSLLYAADGTAYELAVIKLADPADMTELERSLKKHIERRAAQYRQYDPAQVSRAESAVTAVHGAYAALIMCDDNAAAKAVFNNAFYTKFQ